MTEREQARREDLGLEDRHTTGYPRVEGTEGRVHLAMSYYASLCWFGLRQLGFTGRPPNPHFEEWARRIKSLGAVFDFKPPVAGGPMFGLLYQIPAYLNPPDADALDGVQACILTALRTQSMACFHERWPAKTANWGSWYEIDVSDTDRAVDLTEAFFDFVETLWNKYRTPYAQKLDDFPFQREQDRVNSLAIFNRWEKTLDVSYPYAEFRMIICPETPTYASSVGPDAIVFGLQTGREEIVPSVIHEVGVRYSNLDYLKRYGPTADIIASDYTGLLKIIEAETCYQKMRVFPEIETDQFLSPSWEAIVAWREHQTVTFDNYYDHLARMYRQAVKDGVLEPPVRQGG
jgi:hypothetical protein